MKTKIAIVFVALAAVWLGLSYHIRLQNEKGESLVADAYYGDLLAVKNGLEQGAPLRYVLYFQDEERDYGGAEFNALHAAASGGNEDVINFLLDQGLDINSPTPQGWTPCLSPRGTGGRKPPNCWYTARPTSTRRRTAAPRRL